jgi:hypothetical protein
MPLQMAFGITADDVRIVLEKHNDKLVNPNGRSIETLATLIYHGLNEEEMDEIALAAMDSFIDGKPEAEGAHRALRRLLVRRGLLDMSRRAQLSNQAKHRKQIGDPMMAVCR